MLMRGLLFGAVALGGLGFGTQAWGVDPNDTRLLREPDVSAAHVVFVYDDDVWVVSNTGGRARRLTTAPGPESNPHISPDGRSVAFTANYDGNRDVYLMPIEGGRPTRLTWHGEADWVEGFTDDGGVLFSSQRFVHTSRLVQLFTVAASGGPPARLPIPDGDDAQLSPDGRRIAFITMNRGMRRRLQQWRHYRGGTHSRIWIMDRASQDVVEIPQPEERANDLNPVWLDGAVYFLSDRTGTFNVHRYDLSAKAVTAVTNFNDYDAYNLNAGGGNLVFEQGGRLFTMGPGQPPKALVVAVGADLRERRVRYVSDARHIRHADLSPDGKRAVLEYRGEILTVPEEKGDVRMISNSPGTHDRSPAWSPDGKSIAWFSDASGEYSLHVSPQDGQGRVRKVALTGAGFYFDLKWSPDGQWVSYRDNSWSIYVLNLKRGRAKKVAQEPVYGPVVTTHHSWSPDSKWLAYTVMAEGLIPTLHLYSIENGKSFAVTDGMIEAGEPVFDAAGKMLYFLASRDSAGIRDWFSQWNAEFSVEHAVYAVTLDPKTPSPVEPKSDEVALEKKPKGDKDDKKPKAPTVVVARAGIQDRIVRLKIKPGSMRGLRAGKAGQLFVLRSRGYRGLDLLEAPAELVRYDVKGQKETVLSQDVVSFVLSSDGKKALVHNKGPRWSIGGTDKPLAGKAKALPIAKVRVRVDPEREWPQIVREAWKINRDYFYDPGYHGADWPAMWRKYEPMIQHAARRRDIERIIQWMLGELAVGHSYSGPGEALDTATSVSVGVLGADFDVERARYRFRKIYSGLTWRPNDRAPLRGPGVDVKEGEYLLAVDGRTVTAVDNLYSFFQNTAERPTRLTVGPRADGRKSRTMTVYPVASDRWLRMFDWIENNKKRVDRATGGRVAYVWVPNTWDLGHEFFKRYFYPQSHKEALIVDERYNGGGLIADYITDILRRRPIANWAFRYGEDAVSPRAAIFGPKVMIADENAGSGGDLLPWMFKEFGLGPVVGKRTWGGLVGILGFPVLMDGGSVTAPNVAFYTARGWEVENEGVAPDIEVEQWPKAVEAGGDPQLERAIEEVMKQLANAESQRLDRPAYPVRAK